MIKSVTRSHDRGVQSLRWHGVLLLLVVGCGRNDGGSTVVDGNVDAVATDGVPIDVATDAFVPDAALDVPPGPCGWPYVPSNFDPCTLPGPSELDLTNKNFAGYDTDTGQLTICSGTDCVWDQPYSIVVTQSDGSRLRILSLVSLTTPAHSLFEIYGDLPLVIAVHTSATIGGNLAFVLGPRTSCSGSTPGEPSTTGGGGGGGGAGFATMGAAGGRGDAGGAGGSGGPIIDGLVPLRTGCAGSSGGASIGAGGLGGQGGGGLQISTRGTLQIDVTVDVNGFGGRGGKPGGGGGGGGGAGGPLLLEATTLVLAASGTLCAAGGGGGEGGDASKGGGNGWSACYSLPPSAPNTTRGGGGGMGSFGSPPTAGSAADPGSLGGGGGGGGAAGRIGLRATSGVTIPAGMVVLPPATILP